MKKVSIIIPMFNEQRSILDCIKSLDEQSLENFKVIVIDDGSTDQSLSIVKSYQPKKYVLKVFEQKHLGPGSARNLGASSAEGEILVFVDSDMTFDKNFLQKLIEPILEKKTIGTFSKEELVLNKDNIWSQCWNINKSLPTDRMHPKDYPDIQPVFRAILKTEFEKTRGFLPIGYVDDYTISEQLGIQAIASPGAIFYHKNPDNLAEVFNQARWIGKSEYKKRKIKNENIMRFVSIVRYSFPLSFVKGILVFIKTGMWQFVVFKLVYDLAIEISLIKSFKGEQRYK